MRADNTTHVTEDRAAEDQICCTPSDLEADYRGEAEDSGSWSFQDTSLQLHSPGSPSSLSLPTHHILEFHLGNWLSALHLSLAKVGILSPR